jgi:hypothetical protein
MELNSGLQLGCRRNWPFIGRARLGLLAQMSAEGEVRMGNVNPSVGLRRDGEVAVLTARSDVQRRQAEGDRISGWGGT